LTLVCGLIGHPVGHSISPAFQQAAFDALAIDARYERWETPPEALERRVTALRAAPHLGANVTVPHKSAVLDLLDSVDATARRAGAVNTIVTRDGALHGANTDIAGLLRALQTAAFVATGKRALLLGAGGAARAAVLALEAQGLQLLTIANRHRARAEALVASMQLESPLLLDVADWAAATGPRGLEGVDLLINSTTIGLNGAPAAEQSPVDARALHSGTFVCDIVANPRQTPLLRQAAAAGCGAMGGLAMLVFQGAAAFELWTGREAPVQVMFEAAERAMARIEARG
jgi:shikimate dehydrogenase